MSGSDDLMESMLRFTRSVSRAVQREAPYVRRAAGRIVRDDLPAAQRAVEKNLGKVVGDLRRRIK
ncbi:MAG: hypothetical protein M3024_08650 [Candidatus Dormibacteraeota bacterium]|nr:hypothetical protein [Candidatus Dormibacteraeota bacterium]